MEQSREPRYKLMHILCQLIYVRVVKTIQRGKDSVFQLFVLGKLDSCMKKLKLDHCLIPTQKSIQNVSKT